MQNDPLFKPVLEALPMASLLITGDENILYANRKANLLLGDNLVGMAYITVLRHPLVLKAIEATLSGQEEAITQYTTVVGDHNFTYEMTCRRVDLAGQALTLICLSDVTDVEQATQMRRDFVANVSHELRTPLTALKGFIETLQGPARDDITARTRFLDIMADETLRMSRLVEDLLSLSRVESEERMRPIAKVELGALVQSCIVSLEATAKVDDMNVTLRSAAGSEYLIQGDEDQLRQVCNNLLENAIKYGGAGGRITLDIKTVDYDTVLRLPAICLSIRDTGAGIEQHHIPRLTERFYRVDSHRSKSVGGTGLGLAIVKHVVNRHRGRLAIASTLGQGTEFSVFLPSLPQS